MYFLRAGDRALNMDAVTHIELEDGGEVVVYFAGPQVENRHRLALRDEEADELRRWLDENASDARGV